MRGAFADQSGLFSYISPEAARVPASHPLRKIRTLVRDVLGDLNRNFDIRDCLHRAWHRNARRKIHRLCEADAAAQRAVSSLDPAGGAMLSGRGLFDRDALRALASRAA